MLRAVIYCRVSTKEQTQNLSLPTQRRACEEYCRREGLEVARVFMEEGESAKTANRTKLKELVAYCRQNKQTTGSVVVYNLSRFSRDTHDHHVLRALLKSLGIDLRSATEPIDDSATGKLFESILSSFAQFENDVKADRTRAGMRAALELGRWTFQAPLGYLSGERGGSSLVPDPAQAALIRQAFSDYASGRFSKLELLRRINARGLRSRRGKPLTAQTLQAILKNELYAGRVSVPSWGLCVRGDFEPLVAEDVFARVQLRLAGQRPSPDTHARDNPDFPLRRFVRCGDCGRPLTGAWSRGRSARYAYYECPGCREVRVAKVDLERAFVELLAKLQPKPAYMALFSETVLEVWRQRTQASRAIRNSLQAECETLRAKLDDLADAHVLRKVIDAETYKRLSDALREKLAFTRLELEDATLENIDVEGILEFARTVLTSAARLWEQAQPANKQRLQRALFPEGVEFSSRGGIRTAVTCLVFMGMQPPTTDEFKLASPTGFERKDPRKPSSEPADQARKDNDLREDSDDGDRQE